MRRAGANGQRRTGKLPSGMLEEVSFGTGWVEPALREEFRGLGLRFTVAPAQTGRSPRELRARLRHLSDRIHGQRVVNLRREPVASAYRVFFRQIGIDPDEHKPPGEAAMLERLRAGHFRSRDLLEDALTVAVVETGVAVRAIDADRLEGTPGLRIAHRGEHLSGDRVDLPDGAIVVADERRPIGLVFGETGSAPAVTRATKRIMLCVVRVPGIPEISVEEALWTCAGILMGDVHKNEKAEQEGRSRK
jgi:DNA/RNA-binding domain of Phe-tRNA-synthetase-like protein